MGAEAFDACTGLARLTAAPIATQVVKITVNINQGLKPLYFLGRLLDWQFFSIVLLHLVTG
jgi:hypothetical protein